MAAGAPAAGWTRVVEVPQEDEPPPPAATPGRRSGATRQPPLPSGAATLGVEASVPAPAPLGADFELLEEPVPPRRSGPHGDLAPKVLLVDDEDSLRKVMRDLLERDGYVVTEARDGVQALDQVDPVGPDLIVLDLNLPVLHL